MTSRILHVLAQRPGHTGSGITLKALLQHTAAKGYPQQVVVGASHGEPADILSEVPPAAVHPLRFGGAVDSVALPFALPGMSDVMPYASSRYSALSDTQLASYRKGWGDHLRRVIAEFKPQLIHVHHMWLLSSMIKSIAPEIPLVVHGHGTGLRQVELCPHLAEEVRAGVARADAMVVLHHDHARRYGAFLGKAAPPMHVVGAGYREDVFFPAKDARPAGMRLLFAGKLSRAKGLEPLLAAVAALREKPEWRELTLDVAGSGSGAEAEQLLQRITSQPGVRYLGRLAQPQLAEAMRASDVFVLPSYYEGLPLVLVEAAACGCRLVSSDLAGVREELAPRLGGLLQCVALPALQSVDEPVPEAVTDYTQRLVSAIEVALAAPQEERQSLAGFRWTAVFGRVEAVWSVFVGNVS